MRPQPTSANSPHATDTTMETVSGDRTSLDEALFADQPGFAPPGGPVLPDDVAQTLRPDELRSFMPQSIPCGPGLSVITYGIAVEMPLPPGISYHEPAVAFHTPEQEPPVEPFSSAQDLEPDEPVQGDPSVGTLPAESSSEASASEERFYEASLTEEPSFGSILTEEPFDGSVPTEEAPEVPFPIEEAPEVPFPIDLPPPPAVPEPLEMEEEIEPGPLVSEEIPDEVPATTAAETQISLAPLPPRPIPELAVNAGLTVTPGEITPITAEQLCLTGGEASLLDMMVLSAPLHGALVRDGFALTGGDVFTQEDVNENRLHYRHDGGPEEYDSFTFATPEGEVPATVFNLTIEPLRSAPELIGNGQLATILAGCQVADILDGMVSCCAPHLQAGLALIAVSGRGQWQYSLDGTTWLDLPEANSARARLLRESDHLRFVPRPGWSGAVKLSYHAWDQTTGDAGGVVNLSLRNATGGTTAFSKTLATASTTIVPPAHDLDRAVDPWSGTPTVGEVLGTALAVVRLVGAGTWQFSIDGRTWIDFGPVYHGRARLLRATDRVRFLPRRGAGGKVTISGRPWDEHGGSPGEIVSLAAHGTFGEDTPFGEFVKTRTWRLE